jgi:hypothetical protein
MIENFVPLVFLGGLCKKTKGVGWVNELAPETFLSRNSNSWAQNQCNPLKINLKNHMGSHEGCRN